MSNGGIGQRGLLAGPGEDFLQVLLGLRHPAMVQQPLPLSGRLRLRVRPDGEPFSGFVQAGGLLSVGMAGHHPLPGAAHIGESTLGLPRVKGRRRLFQKLTDFFAVGISVFAKAHKKALADHPIVKGLPHQIVHPDQAGLLDAAVVPVLAFNIHAGEVAPEVDLPLFIQAVL